MLHQVVLVRGLLEVGEEARDIKMSYYLGAYPQELLTWTYMWCMALPNRKTCSQHGTQPVGDLLLISSSAQVFSTGDFGHLAGAENKEP